MTTNGHVRHLVIGAGFAGLGAAIKLDEAGETDFLVIEKGHDVGGTWRDNTYPGVACDVPSQLYSFSFAPNPDWSRSFSPQPEIHAYLRKVAAPRPAKPAPITRCLTCRFVVMVSSLGGVLKMRQ